MDFSKEQIYHFVCQACKLWWSIAMDNFNPMLRTWYCPWCGHKHKPPHRDVSKEIDDLFPEGIDE